MSTRAAAGACSIFRLTQAEALRALVGPEISFDGLDLQSAGTHRMVAGPAARSSWMASGSRRPALHGYAAKEGDLVLAVNWAQGRAYYWSRE